MSLAKEFKSFLMRGNVIDLAVGVVIGGAFGKIVTSLVGDILMPFVTLITPAGDWRTLTVTSLNFRVGNFLGATLDFVLIALAVFLAVVKTSQALKPKEAAAAPNTKVCPECLDSIPLAAKRCRSCTSVVA